MGCSLGAAACYLLCMLTRAVLMNGVVSKGRSFTGESSCMLCGTTWKQRCEASWPMRPRSNQEQPGWVHCMNCASVVLQGETNASMLKERKRRVDLMHSNPDSHGCIYTSAAYMPCDTHTRTHKEQVVGFVGFALRVCRASLINYFRVKKYLILFVFHF